MSHMRSVEDQRRLKRIRDQHGSEWFFGAAWDEEKGFYRKLYPPPGYSRNLKWCARRKERNQPELYQRGAYKKIYDYWWNYW